MKFLYKSVYLFPVLCLLSACSGTSYVSGSFVSDQLGSAVLTWDPPIQNNDGSLLTDLNGYVVYYGKKPAELVEVISVDNPEAEELLIEGLASATAYYFVMTAKNSMGTESDYSGFAK